MLIYETEVLGKGDLVSAIAEENMIILFGEHAPSELKDYCVLIDVKGLNGNIQAGDTLTIGDASFAITSVGDVVEHNLTSLGHITLNFNGATTPELAGTLHLEKQETPAVEAGMNITITRK